MEQRYFLCIDLKSFYASVECVDRGLNPFSIPLVVADKERGSGSIVLAVSPYLRNKGIPSRLRVYELPKDEDIIFATPRMNRYLEMSAKVVSIFLDYVGEDDLHIYSIDESFLDVTHYLKFHNSSVVSLAKQIKRRIYKELGLTCTIGIGDNMLLAKIAMDIESKKTQDGIAYWTKEDVPTKLWSIYPLTKFWGIGPRLEKKLNALGILNLYDLAHYPKKLLVDAFGIIGGQLHDHANGIDNTNIREKHYVTDESLTSGQVLFRDYTIDEVPLLIREMLDDLHLRMVYQRKVCSGVSLSVGYSKFEESGFSHQMALITDTDNVDILYDALMNIFNKYKKNKPVRRITIVLQKTHHCTFYQTSLFLDERHEAKKRNLLYTIAKIKHKYGQNAVLRGTSLLESSNIKNRHNLVGGHRK